MNVYTQIKILWKIFWIKDKKNFSTSKSQKSYFKENISVKTGVWVMNGTQSFVEYKTKSFVED